MLHKIKPGAERELRNVMAFQREVLALACDPNIHLPLEKTEILARFPQTGQWLWTHTSLHGPITELNQVVRSDPTLAPTILAAFDNDVSFDQHTDDPGFGFQCCHLSDPAGAKFAVLMRTFYELLCRNAGFSADIAGWSGISRTAVLRSFWTANADLNVCPACDGPRPRRKRRRVHTQYDHFFPKSKHAALSVHPLNLVPVCGDCNYDKLEKDASDHALLSEMFLPYVREAFGPLTVEVCCGKDRLLRISLHDSGQVDTTRLQALDAVLDVKSLWTDVLRTRVSKSIVDTLKDHRKLLARHNHDPDVLLSGLGVLREGVRARRGKEQDAILKEAYFAFLEADPSALAAIR